MAEGTRYYDTGKRKSAIARVWLMPGNGKITVNRRSLESYFPLETHKTLIQEPFRITQTKRQPFGTGYRKAYSIPMWLYGQR